MIVRKIKPEEFKRTEELFAIAFGYPYDCDKSPMEVYNEKMDMSIENQYNRYIFIKKGTR